MTIHCYITVTVISILCCVYSLSSCSSDHKVKKLGDDFQRKGNLKVQAERLGSQVEDAEEMEDKWNAEMYEWIETHKKDVLALDDGEHHNSLVSTYNCTCMSKLRLTGGCEKIV